MYNLQRYEVIVKKEKKKELSKGVFAQNRKARFHYFLSDFLEVGIELKGTEIKSLRRNGAVISDAYVAFRNNEAFIINMHITEYEEGNIFNHEPTRTRKLLMHKREILKYQSKIQEKGYTILPIKVYLYHGRAKLEIALGKGKKLYDKRETIKTRDIERNIQKTMKDHKDV